MATDAAPEGYPTVSPYLSVMDAAGLIEFLTSVFDGIVHERLTRANGSTGHAEVCIGTSMVMLGGVEDPVSVRPASLYVYVENSDATYARALSAGASSHLAPTTMFYGDRVSAVNDPFGNLWWIAQRVEQVSPEEIRRRAAALG